MRKESFHRTGETQPRGEPAAPGYEAFYGLERPAFSLNPDPTLLWQSDTHAEGLATLVYGITRRKGFLLLTGDVGVGKTTLLMAALAELPEAVRPALIVHTAGLGPGDLVEVVAREFGVEGRRAASRIERLYQILDFLTELDAAGQIAVLLVDEAQNLSPEVLEEIRLLSNFETPERKLIQIVLIGQPELRDSLERPELRPLRQRIALAHHVEPLRPEQIRPYLAHRVAAAGGDIEQILKPGAEGVVFEFSQGRPRLVNILLDRLLLAGAVRRMRPLTRAFCEDKTRELIESRAIAID